MDLQRSWRRKIFQATGAGVVAPVAIVAAALAVGIGGGGIRGLGSLGQTLRGPEMPLAEAMGPADGPPAADDLLSREAPRRSRARSAALRARRQAERRESAARRDRGDGGGTRETTRSRPRPTATPQRPSATPSPTPSPAAEPTPTQPSTLRQVGDQVKEIVRPVPIAGEPAAAVVDSLVETAEEVMPRRRP